MCVAKFMVADYEGALVYTEKARTHESAIWPATLISCAALVELGRHDDALAVIEDAVNIGDDLDHRWSMSLTRMPFEDPDFLARFVIPIRRIAPNLLDSIDVPVAKAPSAEATP